MNPDEMQFGTDDETAHEPEPHAAEEQPYEEATYEEPAHEEANAMIAATVLDAAPEPLADHDDMDAVPVTLDFELGKARLSLGAVRALGVGAIVPFGAAAPAAIAILSAGRRLGGGEVVEVDGQLAIRITQWGPT